MVVVAVKVLLFPTKWSRCRTPKRIVDENKKCSDPKVENIFSIIIVQFDTSHFCAGSPSL